MTFDCLTYQIPLPRYVRVDSTRTLNALDRPFPPGRSSAGHFPVPEHSRNTRSHPPFVVIKLYVDSTYGLAAGLANRDGRRAGGRRSGCRRCPTPGTYGGRVVAVFARSSRTRLSASICMPQPLPPVSRGVERLSSPLRRY